MSKFYALMVMLRGLQTCSVSYEHTHNSASMKVLLLTVLEWQFFWWQRYHTTTLRTMSEYTYVQTCTYVHVCAHTVSHFGNSVCSPRFFEWLKSALANIVSGNLLILQAKVPNTTGASFWWHLEAVYLLSLRDFGLAGCVKGPVWRQI